MNWSALFVRLLTLGLLRKAADRARHPLDAGAAGGLLVLAVLLAPGLRRSWSAAGEVIAGDFESVIPRLVVMAGLAAALVVLLGWGYWLRRVREDVARDPWIVLGGSRLAPSVGEVASWTATAAAVFAVLGYAGAPAAAALASGLPGYAALLAATLAASLCVWLGGCAGMAWLFTRKGRGFVPSAGALLLVGALSSLAAFPIIDRPEVVLEAAASTAASLSPEAAAGTAAFSALLFLALAVGYVRVFDLDLRERVRVRLLPRPRRAATKTPGDSTPAAIFPIGAALVRRTMVGRLVLIVAIGLLVGGISTVYLETEGQVTATLFAAVLFCFMVADTARRTRAEVGSQHGYLLNHREQVPPALWSMLVAGEAAVLATTALVCFGAIASFHLSRESAPILLSVAGPVVELAVWLTALAHLLAPRGEGDRWLREVLFWAGAVLVVGVVALKVLVCFTSPFLLTLQSAASTVLALRVGGREPWRPPPAGREGSRLWSLRRKGARS
jgi:hypothetical protein